MFFFLPIFRQAARQKLQDGDEQYLGGDLGAAGQARGQLGADVKSLAHSAHLLSLLLLREVPRAADHARQEGL